jgi:hypothetical protein
LPYNHFTHEVIMRANAGILIFICLLFLVGTVAALIPDTVTISSDKSYLTANNVDQSIIKVNVWNTSSGTVPIQGATVTFSVDPVYGTLTPASGTTDSFGMAISTFKVTTKSGIANINVMVSYTGADGSNSSTKSLDQRIDHDKPNKVIFIPPYEGTVNSIVAFNASFTDQWENPIDNIINLNETHTVTLHVHGPTPDDCYFVDMSDIPRGQDIFYTPLDTNGNVPMKIKLTSVTGNNYLSMEAFGLTIPAKVIRVVPAEPFYMTTEIAPAGTPPKLPAGASFAFTYTFYDKFWNPAGGFDVWVNTSSWQELVKTQENGKISGTYSETFIGDYTITATAVNGNHVTNSSVVRFYAAEATSHNVVANPKMMPSRDVKTDIYSDISAKVVDAGGNGVNGQTVTFTISDESYSPAWVGSTSKPSFSPTSYQPTITAITGTDGINGSATAKFYPGAFVKSGTNYSQSATGNATITASWNSIPKTVDVSWKNYAFLSAVLSITPPQVKVGDTVDVNLKLNGDGFSMTTTPIDVDLVIDRSGSMDGSRLGIMSGGNNGVGLVSFASGVTLDKSLTWNDFDGVNTSIGSLSAHYSHSTDMYTNMREGLYTAVNDIDGKARSGSVKAIILLTDGDWNYNGTLLGHGTGWPADNPDHNLKTGTTDFDNYLYIPGLGGTLTPYSSSGVTRYICTDGEFTTQNLSRYAEYNGVRVYVLSFVQAPSTNVQNAMRVVANNTGGFYKHAATDAELEALYTEIAGLLIEDAGVATTAEMDFGHLIVDDQLLDTSIPGNAVLDYVGYDPDATGPGSTMVNKYNATYIPTPSIINQTQEWIDNHALNFDIGLIKLHETWETNFRFKVLKEGTIMLFSPGSTVNFVDYKGDESSLSLNNLSYFTVVNDATGLEIQKIEVLPICPSNVESTAPLLPFEWDTIYNGTATTIYEEGRYMSESGAWVMFYSGQYGVSEDDTRHRSATFDMRRVAPGSYTINIKVYTTGSRATSSPTCGPYLYNTTGVNFIRLR